MTFLYARVLTVIIQRSFSLFCFIFVLRNPPVVQKSANTFRFHYFFLTFPAFVKPLKQCYHLDAAAGWVALATEYLLGSQLCQVFLYQKLLDVLKSRFTACTAWSSTCAHSRNITRHADWWRVLAFIIRNANKKESFDHHVPYDSFE